MSNGYVAAIRENQFLALADTAPPIKLDGAPGTWATFTFRSREGGAVVVSLSPELLARANAMVQT